jgi:Holliday junction resolvase RusA-like endonuclease
VTALSFTVIGLPAPQGSKRHVGRGVLIESSKKVKPWREDVRAAALAAGAAALTGPIHVTVTFTLPRPTSAPKSRRWPDRRPDLDKLVRSTFDALTSAGVYGDDAQVTNLNAAKTYPNTGPDALDRPGAIIHITPLGDTA